MKKNTSYLFVIFLVFLFTSVYAGDRKRSYSDILPKFNFYLDTGYIFSNYNLNYSNNWVDLSWDEINVRGKNYFDVTTGAQMLFRFRKVPFYVDVNVSNLYEGTRGRGNAVLADLFLPIQQEKDTWKPVYSFSIGSYKTFGKYTASAEYFYSRNVRDKNETKSHGVSGSLTRFIKTVPITAVFGLMNREMFFEDFAGTYTFDGKVLFSGISISYPIGYITPYISYYREMDNRLERFTVGNSGDMFGIGMRISSNKSKGIVNHIKYNFPFDYNIISRILTLQ